MRSQFVVATVLTITFGSGVACSAGSQRSAEVVASPAAAEPATMPAIARYFGLVRGEYSGDRARQTVAFVEQYFRIPGNTGFNASIDSVVGVLRGAGYVDASRAAPGDRLVYRVERYPMSGPTWEPEDGSLAIVGQSAPVLRFATNRNMIAINSYSTPPEGVEAELVYVGRGTPAALDSAKVAGKIVFGESGIGGLFREAVVRRGALGVLSYGMPAYTKPEIHRTSIQFSSIPADSARRGWGIQLSYAARQALLDAVRGGPVRVRVMTRTKVYPSEERTLVAEVRGSREPEERFVFSAHVQEPGANDNASGVGAQAEMARVAARLVQRGAVDPWRTITFLWGNEIVATRRYLVQDSVRARGVRWGVSLDMVGEDTKKTGGTFLIEKMPDPSAIWTRGDDQHSEWGGSPLEAKDLTPHWFNDYILARCLEQAATTGWVVRTNPFEGGSDHTPFLAAKKPGLLLWHFTDVFYHTDNDRLENVSAATLANVGTAALVSALTLASADSTIARGIVAETRWAAERRLETETRLSLDTLQRGGTLAHESLILTTWAGYYRDAIRAATDIETGGTSEGTRRAIEGAAAAVERLGAAKVWTLQRSRQRDIWITSKYDWIRPSLNAFTDSAIDARSVTDRGPDGDCCTRMPPVLNTARRKVLEESTGSAARFAKKPRQASLWKRYCSTLDV